MVRPIAVISSRLLTGLVTSLAVAVACCVLPHQPDPESYTYTRTPLDDEQWWILTEQPSFGVTWLSRTESSRHFLMNPWCGSAPTPDITWIPQHTLWWSRAKNRTWTGRPKSGFPDAELVAGWPLFCLWGEALEMAPDEYLVEFDGFYVPLLPLLRGLLANSIIYGLAWSLLMWFGGRARARWRRRAGRCVRCNYNLCATVAGVCPECGADC